jgi:FkbM family methyltransferase
MKILQRFKDLRYFAFYRLLTRNRGPLLTLGTTCQWTICNARLGRESRVLSAGAGNDISFEKALIHRFRCPVVLLDPSPTGAATVLREAIIPEKLQFLPVGLAAGDGELAFREPIDATEGSYAAADNTGSSTRTFPCLSLSTVMEKMKWREIDLLKIDIEGSEYSVLQNLLEKALRIRQICVEFHYGPQFGRSRADAVRMILGLWRAGYDLVHHVNFDHTFMRRDVAPNVAKISSR